MEKKNEDSLRDLWDKRDGKEKPNRQRESLQKGPVQQVKIPEGNIGYTGRGL